MRQLSRDPFARLTYYKESAPHGECAECGRIGKRYRYGSQSDGLYTQIEWHPRAFCSKGCHDVYTGA